MTPPNNISSPRWSHASHARTLDELRAEFCGDLARRIEDLDARLAHPPSATESSRVARAKMELEKALEHWQSITLRPRKSAPPTVEPTS